MIIKGLSNYDISLTNDGILSVYSRSHRKEVRVTDHRGRAPGFRLQADTDTGKKTIWLSAVQHRLLIESPQLSVWDLYNSKTGRKVFSGNNANILDGLPRFRGDCFRNIDDAIETCLLLKKAQKGDITPIVSFLHGARTGAVGTVSGFTGLSCARVDLFWDEAEELFLEQIKTFRVRRLMPLYPWICKCLKEAIAKSKNTVHIDETRAWEFIRE